LNETEGGDEDRKKKWGKKRRNSGNSEGGEGKREERRKRPVSIRSGSASSVIQRWAIGKIDELSCRRGKTP